MKTRIFVLLCIILGNGLLVSGCSETKPPPTRCEMAAAVASTSSNGAELLVCDDFIGVGSVENSGVWNRMDIWDP